MKKIKQIVSLSTVVLLLFAWGFKSAHVLFEHGHDEACYETKAHFHEAEHDCFICDFDFQQAEDFTFSKLTFHVFCANKKPFFYYGQHTCVNAFFAFDSRGPPIV